ncbi:MAG: NRDE family protein [Acidobacteriota bacterium]
MCTLILYHRCRDDWPLVVAANRDERLDRPASPPRALGGRPKAWAGLDREAGGTWLGLNAAGLVVGITNAARARRDPSLRSRGLLVVDLLREADADSAARSLQALRPGSCNPFQILLADPRRAFLGAFDGAIRVEQLNAGVHVLTNAAPGDPEEPRRAEVLRLLGVAGSAETKSLDDLKRILARHAPVPERSVCLHRPSFGTRAGSLIAVGGRRAPLYVHAEGPPCRVAFEDVSPRRSEFKLGAASRASARRLPAGRRIGASRRGAPRSRRIHP